MKTNYIGLIFLLVFWCIGCESDDDTSKSEQEITITSGQADFSRYVAVGNSLTAGFTDGALFIAGQENSMANILATQFALAGGGEFKQPLMSDNIGGILLGGMPIQDPRFYFFSDPNPDPPNESGPKILGTSPTDKEAEMPTTEVSNVISGPFNNMGVPGAKSFHLLADGYGNVAGVQAGLANPYFVRMASSPTTSVMTDVMAQNPTFFSLWIGNNDVLGYALAGGDSDKDEITDQAIFAQSFNGIVNILTSSNAKGVAFNIPDVTSIPHFTTVPHNPVTLDESTATAVNNAYAAYNTGIVQAYAFLVGQGAITQADADAEIAKRTITFEAATDNPVVILDENLTDLKGINADLKNMRQATSSDLLVLSASTFIGTQADPMNPLSINGVALPLEDKWVLTPEEQEQITAAITAFNAVIEAAVKQAGIAFVDANAILKSASENGVAFDEFLLKDDLVFGGAFSLDGVHLTARGYAFIANKAIDEINATYGSNLPWVKAVNYPTFYPIALP